jgi:hypothetical protein
MLFGHPTVKLDRQLRASGYVLTEEELKALQQQFLKTFSGLSKLQTQARMQATLPACPVVFPTGMRRTLAQAKPWEITSLRAKGTVGVVIKQSILQLAEHHLDQYLSAVVGEELLLTFPKHLCKMEQEEVLKEVEKCLREASKIILGVSVPVHMKVSSHWG